MSPADNILHASLKLVLEKRATLPRAHARELLDYILDHDDFGAELRTSALLGALAARGETPEELAGFVDCLRARLTPIPLTAHERRQCVDTCGTGGDLSGTFNISTAAGLVAAAVPSTPGRAQMMVAKHGNRAVTSRSGSADVLEALGIPVDHTPQQAAESLRRHRFAFLAAPALQPAMKAVMPIRRAIGVRTLFNLLGPLTNPAGAQSQLIGVYSAHLVPVIAHTLALLGTRHAIVVHGAGGSASGTGLDEISISGPTAIAEVKGDQVTLATLTPGDFQLSLAPIETLHGGDAETNAAILRAIFAGQPGPPRNVVVLNAAALLVAAGVSENFLNAARLAEHTIDAGHVTRLIAALAAAPNEQPRMSSHQI